MQEQLRKTIDGTDLKKEYNWLYKLVFESRNLAFFHQLLPVLLGLARLDRIWTPSWPCSFSELQ